MWKRFQLEPKGSPKCLNLILILHQDRCTVTWHHLTNQQRPHTPQPLPDTLNLKPHLYNKYTNTIFSSVIKFPDRVRLTLTQTYTQTRLRIYLEVGMPAADQRPEWEERKQENQIWSNHSRAAGDKRSGIKEFPEKENVDKASLTK